MKNCGSCYYHDKQTDECKCCSSPYFGEHLIKKASPCFRWRTAHKGHIAEKNNSSVRRELRR